ncbi:MAG: class I SAM-dependent methyltransferase [Pseudomonadota bacterium]|jgi:SAM-dependent methyltransferase|uniref:Demethylmenaquinone methyltransferase n=1 Tax=anaerobic digester metagenome TaxID=1263854 RepID=A0A485M3W3_9ZZZZ|nr:class I SAM-dependent methyltransferase [Pseudomonadota bacterium]HON38224.1 class I SAM-dependent methyltransferase [Deltaproteobacteria bacterium]HRV35809.1 class I SAM-dependent methyltransferase [Desulfomonilia bacterium]
MEKRGGSIMSDAHEYLMENPQEAHRLDIKTDIDAVRRQALLCGIKPGARVLDGGCGSGKTTTVLHSLVQPGGQAVGIDFAPDRIEFARDHYGKEEGIEFLLMDLRGDLGSLGTFDFIWIRFVLEYYLQGAVDIIKNAARSLKPGGTLCLLDLDYNCLSHYPLPDQMEQTLKSIMEKMMREYNFDPFAGRKLYTHMYDLGFEDIQVHMMPHHLMYGELKSSDDFNWLKKVQMASVKAGDLFDDYPGGREGFFGDFVKSAHDPRRFTYSPLIVCTGKKPTE